MDNKNKVQKSSKKKVNEEIHEPVTNGDQSVEVVANCDHLRSLKFRPTLPFAFTEQGIGQLSSVVHSKKAIERSIAIMASVKDIGAGLCAITEMQTTPDSILDLIR